MKKIFLILIAINIFTTIYAQDKEPIQHKFYFPAYSEIDSVYLSDTLEFFKQDKFMFGWHWGGSKKISRSLNMNQKDISSKDFFEYEDIDSSVYLIVKSVRDYAPDYKMFYTHCDNKAQLVHAKAIQYEPTLKINSANMSAPDTNNYDGTNPVFGFKGVRGRVENDTLDHRSRLVLDSAGLNGQVVLDEPWLGGCLFRHDKGINPNNTENKEFLGYEWYITINLRRYDWDIYYDTSNVLKIEMPYILGMNGDSSLIVFDSIPYPYPFTTTLPNNRGKAQRLDSNRNRTNYFYIKRSMLPFYSENITISARFKLDNDIYQNPKLKDGMVTYLNNVIDTLKIRVTYYNNCNVAIDWIRIETPNAQRYFRGFYDNAITSSLQIDLKDFSDKRKFTNRGIKFFRFNSFIESSYQDWAAERYFNKLVDTLAAVECFTHQGNTPSHFLHSTGFKEYWSGSNIDFYSNNGVPFVKRAEYNCPMTFNYYWGYSGLTEGMQPIAILDSLHSDYETKLFGPVVTLPVTDLNIYEYPDGSPNYYNSNSTQFQIEKLIYQNYYKNPSLFYSSKPWWANLWVQSDGLKFYNEEIESFTVESFASRPKTGEEIRLMATLPVLLGAKGLIYWFKSTSRDWKKGDGAIGLQPYSEDYSSIYGGLSGEQLLKSNALGGDYVCFPDANKLDSVFNKYGYLFNIMNIDSNHIYLGLASTRLAISRVNHWVQNCEDELMKLRLVAWYGKGYLTLYHQDPAYGSDTIMKSFLSLDIGNIRTRQIGRYFKFKYERPDYEPWDSSFVDITLLRNVDTTMSDVFYVSALNRRTDPLIYYQPPQPPYGTPPDPYIRFLSTSEFEDSCDATKNPNGYERIRSYWWKKLGAREVSVNFNYKNPNDNEEYALLRVTELGAEEEFNENWSYCKKQSFWNKIDTVIGQDRPLPVKLQPGEGKIFRVQVLHPEKNIIGELEHSNQSKLVGYPDLDSNGNETSSWRYYLTYHKPITEEPSRKGVYFRRSIPVSKDCMEENIKWEQELLVSDSVLIDTNEVVARSCDYPSIVVRKDTNGVLNAYIVYSCYKKLNKNMIAETILDVSDSNFVEKQIGVELSEYNGLNRYEWGNPVINASSIGNYYSWSDSIVGIVAAYKVPNDIYFNNQLNKISFRYTPNFGLNVLAQHPSLNVYSHLDSLEDNCALVWQEKYNYEGPSTKHILYTRLKWRADSNKLIKYKADKFIGDSTKYSIRYNIAQLAINDSSVLSRNFPVISRKIGPYRKTQSGQIFPNRQDLIFWENTKNYSDSAATYLMSCVINLYDSDNNPKEWEIYNTKYIKSAYRRVSLPNITHGYSIINNGIETCSINEISLNFSYGLFIPNQIHQNIYVGHYNSSDFSYIYSLNDTTVDLEDKWVRLVGSGTLSHLSQNKKFLSSLWQNRRVYNNIDNDTNFILTSAKYFYKGQSDEMLADWYIGFETADSNKKSFLFGAPELDEQRFSLKLPFEKVVSDEGYISFVETSSDTIASSWFSIEDAKELALKLKGSNNANSRVYIQNKETERTLRLNLPNGLKENKGAKAKYNLINGLGNEFRLLFVKNDEAMQYTEELWIEGLPIEEKPAGSFKGNDGIENIDLIQIVNRYYSDNDISIFPNPALEVLYLQTNVPYEEANLTVTNLLGTKVIQQQINLRSSPELKLDISFLLPGIYYVNISDGLSSISGKFLKR